MEEKKENKGKEDNIKVEPLAKHKVANAVSQFQRSHITERVIEEEEDGGGNTNRVDLKFMPSPKINNKRNHQKLTSIDRDSA